MSGTNPFANNLSMFGQAAAQPPGQAAPMFGQPGGPPGSQQAGPMFPGGQAQQQAPQIDYAALFQALMQNPQIMQQMQAMQAPQPSPGTTAPQASQFQPMMPPQQASPFPSVAQMLAPQVPPAAVPDAPVAPPPIPELQGSGGEGGGF